MTNGFEPPYAFQLGDGIDRDRALVLIEAHRSGRLRPVSAPYGDHLWFGTRIGPMVNCSGTLLPEGIDDQEAMDLVVGIVEACIAIPPEQHPRRLMRARTVLESIASILAPPEGAESGMMATSACLRTPARYGAIKHFPGGWTTTPVPDPEGRPTLSAVSIVEGTSYFEIDRYDTRLYDVPSIDVLERLRLEILARDLVAEAHVGTTGRTVG